jgi:predicted Zn finger-like uncharacterized protein
MIVACPGCGRRYRLPDSAGAQGGRRLRCAACLRVFEAVPQAPGRAAAPAGRAATARATPLALVGEEDREFRQLVRRTLETLGCRVEVTDDGEAAFRYAVARRPALMVLNVYLKRLLGVAVCEGVKGSPDLKGTRVVLVGSVFKSGRFMRSPGSLYGADDYFEDVIPEEQLRARLQALLDRAPAAPAGAVLSPRPPAPAAGGEPPSAADLLAVAPNGADEPIDPRSEIRRLARIMISDLKIYHPDGFREAILERRFAEAFREELTQAKDLIGRRFPGMPDGIAVLTEALKEQIAEERAVASRRPAGSAS